MKRFTKAFFLIIISFALGAESNSCAISQSICEKKIIIQEIPQGGEIDEINAWSLTSKFNF